MTSREFAERLERRARQANVAVPADAVALLEAYYRLLMRWNSKINLTALPLADAPDRALDRLLIEPLAAARYVPETPLRWFDLGSGGGSPAIPLKITRPAAMLTMVEAKTRKAAFLSEAARELRLTGTSVEDVRMESLLTRPELRGVGDLMTVRAVRLDRQVGDVGAFLLKPGGQLHLFRSTPTPPPTPAGFTPIAVHQLADGPSAHLAVFEAQQ